MNINFPISLNKNLSFASLLIISSSLTPFASKAMDLSEFSESAKGNNRKSVAEEKENGHGKKLVPGEKHNELHKRVREDNNNNRNNEYINLPKKRKDIENLFNANPIPNSDDKMQFQALPHEKENGYVVAGLLLNKQDAPDAGQPMDVEQPVLATVVATSDDLTKTGDLFGNNSPEKSKRKNRASTKVKLLTVEDAGFKELQEKNINIKTAKIETAHQRNQNEDGCFRINSTYYVEPEELFTLIVDEAKKNLITEVCNEVPSYYKQGKSKTDLYNELVKVAVLTNGEAFPTNIQQALDNLKAAKKETPQREAYRHLLNQCRNFEISRILNNNLSNENDFKDRKVKRLICF